MNIRAFAKINIGLRILRKRDDGYHELETVFHRINIADDIEISPSATIDFSTSGQYAPSDDTNLCVRAAQLLRKEYHVQTGAAIRLTKRIPSGAGLGGGSADAAATLLGLNELWKLRLSADQLLPIALGLGSDVPYFLMPGSAHATGRGEILDYFTPDIPFSIVVVCPSVQISTAWAYANIRLKKQQYPASLRSDLIASLNVPASMSDRIRNDFEELIFTTYPAIAELSRRLRTSGAFFTQLSGSGSAVFGCFMDEQQARASVNLFAKSHSTYFTPPHFIPPGI